LTNAEKHVQALIGQFGPPPFALPGFGVTVTGLSAEGGVLEAVIDDGGKILHWQYASPEVWVPDPAGDIPRTFWITGEDGELTETEEMGREAPLEIAAVQLAHHLALWRSR